MRKTNLLILLLSLISISLNATHYSSGYITYRHVGGQNGVPVNSYEVEVVVYRNLNNSQFLGTSLRVVLRNGCTNSVNSYFLPRMIPVGTEVHPSDPLGYRLDLSHNCSDSLNDDWSLYKFRDTISISAVCGNLRLIPDFNCCRDLKDNLRANSTSSRLTVYADLNTLNGPVSLPKPDPALMIARLCAGGLYELYGFVPDTLVEDWRFEKVGPLDGSTFPTEVNYFMSPLPYKSGYTIERPLPVDTVVGYQLDSISGFLRLKPTAAGLYAINLLYKQYDTIPSGALVLSGSMHIETAILVDTNCYASVTSGPQLRFSAGDSVQTDSCKPVFVDLKLSEIVQLHTVDTTASQFLMTNLNTADTVSLSSLDILANDSLRLHFSDSLNNGNYRITVQAGGADSSLFRGNCGFESSGQIPLLYNVQGCVNFSLKEAPSKRVFLYPNPTKSILRFSSLKGDPIQKIEIRSLDGQLLQMAMKPSNQMDVSSLKSGSYFLRLEMVSGYLESHLFVKE